MPLKYGKIPKIIPRAYIFQGPFLRGLFLEGLIYGGKFAFQNLLGKPYSWKEISRFCFVLLCIWGQFPSTSPGGGAYIWRSLFSEFYGTPIIQFVRMNWSFLLKKRNTLLSVGIVFVKHTLKFRKYVKIFQIIKTLFVMYHGHLKVTTNSIFSLICPFQEPVMLSTTHWMLPISLSQTKPSTFAMIFPSHPDIALNQLVSPQCLRLAL